MSPSRPLVSLLRRRAPDPQRPTVVLPDHPAPDAGRLTHDETLAGAEVVPPQRSAIDLRAGRWAVAWEPAGSAP